MDTAGREREELTAAVGRARRRILVNEALRQAAMAATITLLGPTFLLFSGRHWFTWPVLAAFLLAGSGFAAWRFWNRRPGLYPVSQALDVRLSTHDQISTAIYFLDASQETAVEQRRAAALLAQKFQIEDVFPLTAPRSLYALASVFLVASALWAIRYFLEKPFRLEQPLPRIIAQALWGGDLRRVQEQKGAGPENRDLKQAKASPLNNEDLQNAIDRQKGQETSTPGNTASPDPGNEAGKPDDPRGQDKGNPSGDEFGDPMAANSEDQPIQSYEDMLERDAKSGLSKAEGKQGKDGESQSNQNDGKSGNQESNSLLAKLREAMNNMLSRLQQKAPGNGNQQQAAGGEQNNGAEEQEGRGEGRSGAGQPQPGGKEGAEGEGSEGDAKDSNAQSASGKTSGKSSEGGTRGTTGDGAGQQEGDKTIAEAQQEAMGKLSELYGRRAANITGEVTVEAQAGKQTLRTPQSAKQAHHQDSGGEIGRDEIPLAYQAYVKEYFNKLRQADKK